MTLATRRLPSLVRHAGASRSAAGLGWFSIGLGLVELLAPRAITGPLGLRGRDGLVRAFGAREIGTGIGLLTATDPSPWLWGRVAGDALDIAMLAAGLRDDRRPNVFAALAMLAAIAALDAYCASRATLGEQAPEEAEVERRITVGASAPELLQLLQEPDTLARIMAHFAAVQPAGADLTRWTLPGPVGSSFSWTMRSVVDGDDGGLCWEAEPGQPALLGAASARLHPGPRGRGTVVSLRARFGRPGLSGGIGRMLPELVPGALLDTSLHFLKSLAETGEIPTTERQPAARSDTR